MDSKINIQGIVNDIRKKSNIYDSIVEGVTNSIDAIQETGRKDGKITIRIFHDTILEGSGTGEINKVFIEDNGIGFNKTNLDSFNELYSLHKSDIGGKGFGRFFFIKYFKDVNVTSVYGKNGKNYKISFKFGKKDTIVDNLTQPTETSEETGSKLTLNGVVGSSKLDIDLEIFSGRILECILSYFSSERENLPEITIVDGDNQEERFVLNDYLGKNLIEEKTSGNFSIDDIQFEYNSFILRRPRTSQKSQVFFTARNQAIGEGISLSNTVKEFAEEFYDNETNDKAAKNGKYIVYYYIKSNYFEKIVNAQRNELDFPKNSDNLYNEPTRKDVLSKISDVARKDFEENVKLRIKKKQELFTEYTNDNPWYSDYYDKVDFSVVKVNPEPADIENEFHKVKYETDTKRKEQLRKIVDSPEDKLPSKEDIDKAVSDLQQTNISELAQYMTFRKLVLDLLESCLKWKDDGKFDKEATLHNIIFPMHRDSSEINYDEHNLWILDESLSFVQYLTSDIRNFKDSQKRTDLLGFHKPIIYSERLEPSNPITIFEFKRPNRDDFATDPKADAIRQVVDYIDRLRNGELKTPDGVNININENTPCYGYIVGSDTPAIRSWLKQNEMMILPDNEGWYSYRSNYKLYLKYITWNKVVKDANVRHQVFFDKLGLGGQ
jgi:hypothetical protein